MARPQIAGEGDRLYVNTNIAVAAAESDWGKMSSLLEPSRLRTVGLQYNNGMKSSLSWDISL
jgi:hypothetical protein